VDAGAEVTMRVVRGGRGVEVDAGRGVGAGWPVVVGAGSSALPRDKSVVNAGSSWRGQRCGRGGSVAFEGAKMTQYSGVEVTRGPWCGRGVARGGGRGAEVTRVRGVDAGAEVARVVRGVRGVEVDAGSTWARYGSAPSRGSRM
jgi:hypothetical protein